MITDPRRTGWPYADPAQTPAFPPTLPDGSPWPRITVVTPSFNQGRYIEQTILSVLNQNYPSVEHIVMDGGSTDETLDVLDRYRPRLAHAVSEKDRGQSHAINKGMALATSDIVTWVNSDDMLAPGALAGAAMAFHTSGADMIAGVCRLYRDGHYVGAHLTSCLDNEPLPLNDLLDLDHAWNVGQFFYQPETMYKRDLWLRAGGHVDESLYYSMDYELWLRFALAGAKLHVIGRPIAHFRMHEEQKTNVAAKFKTELVTVRDAFVKRHNLNPKPLSPRTGAKQHLRVTVPDESVGRALATAGHHVTVAAAPVSPDDLDLSAVTRDVVAVSPEYQPVPKRVARELLGLPTDSILIVAEPAHLSAAESAARAAKLPAPRSLNEFPGDTVRCVLLLAAADVFTGTDPTAIAQARTCATAVSSADRLAEADTHSPIFAQLHATNEYSQSAAVHRIHNALTRSGFADRIPLSRKIAFAPTPAPITILTPAPDEPIDESLRLLTGFGPWQEAQPAKNLPRCCWAIGHSARLELRTPTPGPRRLTLTCRNFQQDQSVEILLAGRPVAQAKIPLTTAADHTLTLPFTAGRGVTPLELRFAKTSTPAPKKPARAILVTRIACDP